MPALCCLNQAGCFWYCVSKLTCNSKPLKNVGVLLGIFFPHWPFCGYSCDELGSLHVVSFLLSMDCLVFYYWKLSNVISCLQLNEFNLVSLVYYLEHMSAWKALCFVLNSALLWFFYGILEHGFLIPSKYSGLSQLERSLRNTSCSLFMLLVTCITIRHCSHKIIIST